MKPFIFTLDLEADYAGQVNQYEIFKEPDKIEQLLSVLDSMGLKITVFTVGNIFEQYQDIVKIFQKHNCEFEAHSYSHDTLNPDSESEIQKARLAYFNYFKRYPKGYRTPQGRVSDSIIKLLERHDFLYDSSIFPSYYPNPLRYLFCNRNIHYFKNSNIMEIPIASITPFRLTLSLSYIKMLGIEFYFKLFNAFKLPDTICFSAHLHDFIINEDSYGRLPKFWKLVYSRNKYSGTEICLKFLEYIKKRNYNFCYLSDVVREYK